MKRFIVAISGATGAIYGIRLLEALAQQQDVETHLVMSDWARETIAIETSYSADKVMKLADYCHDLKNVGASIASGSFRAVGMAVAPCSMKTLSAIAHGLADNLIVRAADVMLKEKRKLVLVPRETPLNMIHLENMMKAARAGASLLPPMPAYYNHPKTIDDIVNHLVGRILDHFDLPNNMVKRWGEDCGTSLGKDFDLKVVIK